MTKNPKPPASRSRNEFNDYRVWVTQAATASKEPVTGTALQNAIQQVWDSYQSGEQAEIAAQIREIWDSRRDLAGIDQELNDVLRRIIDYEVRALNMAATMTTTTDLLGRRQTALNGVLAALLSLKATEDQWLGRRFGDSLQLYLDNVIENAENKLEEAEALETLTLDFDSIEHTRVGMATLRNLAIDIRKGLENSTTGISPSASKRGREGDDDDDDADEASRPSKRKGAPDNQSAQAGASQGSGSSGSFFEPPPAPPGQAPPPPLGQPSPPPPPSSLAGLPLGPAPVVPLPQPFANGLGDFSTQLFALQDQFGATYKEWCRRQLTYPYPDAGVLEAHEKAMTFVRRYARDDHDWNYEPDVPLIEKNGGYFWISELADYQRPWLEMNAGRTQPRDWPNVRRLLRLINREGDDCQQYFRRHLYDIMDRKLPLDANVKADELIGLLQRRGQGHDWELEDDRCTNLPHEDDTKGIPLAGLNAPGVWIYHKPIGGGGNGRAVLWVRAGMDGRIQQRVVTKECAVGQGWRAYDRLDSIPFEAYLHDSLPRDDHIIEYLGVSIIRRLRTYRLYTAYAELGDLQQLFKNHQDALSHRDHNGERIEAHIPIIALLYIFEAMAASVCLMAHGLLPDDQGNWPESHGDGDAPLGHWGHNIIHSDIKPANYFLSRSANSTVWPELPVAALGDFGNGLDLDEPQYKNDINLARRMGTVRWQSPEQVSNHATEHAVTSATNVYQVGLCIMSLMTLSNPTHDVSYEGNQGSPFPPGVPGFYPSMIIELVNECLQMNSADRPSPKRLYMDVRNLAMEYPERGTHGIPWQFQRVSAQQFVRTEQHPHEDWMAR